MANEFLGIFQHLQRKRKRIDLVNVYKGLPVVSSVRIIYVSPQSIIVQPDANQLVCLSWDRQALIQHEYFPRLIMARVATIDLLSCEVELTDFAYTGPGIGNRKHLRIQPEELVMSTLQMKDTEEKILGDMVDMSRAGLAIYVNRTEIPAGFTEIGTQVNVFFRLPVDRSTAVSQDDERTDSADLRDVHLEGDELTLVGVVVNSQMDAVNGWWRIGLRLAPWHAANEALLQFIDRRREEIMQELKAHYAELMDRQE